MERIKSSNTDPLLTIFKRKMPYLKDIMYVVDRMTINSFITIVLIIDVDNLLKKYDINKDSIDVDFANKPIYYFTCGFNILNMEGKFGQVKKDTEELEDYFKEVAKMLIDVDNEELAKQLGPKEVSVSAIQFYFDLDNKY